MPRLSPEARATLTSASVGKLTPSAHLSPSERRAWRSIVAATPAGHLSERDRPLLETYVALAVAQRKLSDVLATASPDDLLDDGAASTALQRIESIGKTLCALSNRLKLAPLAQHSAPHKAGQREEQPKAPPLLGGMVRIK